MISEHEFNSQWCGTRAGILKDLRFFTLPPAQRQEMLAAFAWVELHAPMQSGLPLKEINEAGFSYVDTQMNFRIGLRAGVLPAGCADELEVRTAEDANFALGEQEWCPFLHERFQFLAGTSQESIDRRYRSWARDLVLRNPACCLQFTQQGEPQGWFLAQPDSPSQINLTLAVLHKNARVSGFVLYGRAMEHYARAGYRSGRASFSILHTAVHNIYAHLGARFETPVAIWFWTRGKSSESSSPESSGLGDAKE